VAIVIGFCYCIEKKKKGCGKPENDGPTASAESNEWSGAAELRGRAGGLLVNSFPRTASEELLVTANHRHLRAVQRRTAGCGEQIKERSSAHGGFSLSAAGSG